MFGKFKKMLKQETQILAPVAGQAVPITEVSDQVFKEEIVGKGLAIIPSSGRVVAPADGTVSVMFNTGHAVSVTSSDGAEILIHVGLDTVNLKGQFYTPHVKQGDTVKAGDLLLEFDKDQIAAAGYDIITPVVICNHDIYQEVTPLTGKEVKELDPILTLRK